MYVDLDGNGSRDTTMVFEPYYSTIASGGTQPNLTTGAWQTWDAIGALGASKWWFTTNVAPWVAFDNFVPWSQIVAAYPNARIVTWYSPGSPVRSDGWGMNLVAGQNSAGGPWNDFIGNVDAFRFSAGTLDVSDFEPASTCDDGNAHGGHLRSDHRLR